MEPKTTLKTNADRPSRDLPSTAEAARWVRELTGLDNDEQALAALEVVAGGIVRRILPEEANDFVTCLPNELRELLLELPAGPDARLSVQSVQRELANRLVVNVERALEISHGVGIALRWLSLRGGGADVLSHLPREFRILFPPL
jgi:uncharacterized protein (DUF2267 family)